YLAQSNLGEQLRQTGQPGAAAQVFAEILDGLEETPSYQRCLTLGLLGRCSKAQGQPGQAEQIYRQELEELAQLEQSDGVQRQTGSAWTDLADVLRHQGEYSKAKEACQASLDIKGEIDDVRGRAVVMGQLGTLAYMQGELAEAEERYKEALALFQRINEPAHEAIYTHQLGMVYQQEKQWKAAEQAYRQAARLFENLGGGDGKIKAGASWDQLAQVCESTDRPAEAEQWYGKALAACRAADDRPGIAITLNNLADLVANDPARLDEARDLAEEALAIWETLDPATAQLWKIYTVLADIAKQQGESHQSAAYRAKSRQAYFAFPGWRQQLEENEEIIYAVVEASISPEMQDELEAGLDELTEQGWDDLVAAIESILSGERDEAALCEPLDYEDAAVIRAILEGIAGQG
ncbi:MAG: tetratricopeptide repeat protein, partial [Candidatus Electrothrix sp. AX5]|nr:tetratricopeptide repeat protein [Candidatus Electrothrix sp. AX5]